MIEWPTFEKTILAPRAHAIKTIQITFYNNRHRVRHMLPLALHENACNRPHSNSMALNRFPLQTTIVFVQMKYHPPQNTYS